jgi:hypothetical protein
LLTQRDSLDLIEPIYSTLDEPFADASMIPTHLLSRFARQFKTHNGLNGFNGFGLRQRRNERNSSPLPPVPG